MSPEKMIGFSLAAPSAKGDKVLANRSPGASGSGRSASGKKSGRFSARCACSRLQLTGGARHVVDPLAGAQARDDQKQLHEHIDRHERVHIADVQLPDERRERRQRQTHCIQRPDVAQHRIAHVAAAAQHADDVRQAHARERLHEDHDQHHVHGNVARRALHVHQRQDVRPQQHVAHERDDAHAHEADDERQSVEHPGLALHLIAIAAADLPPDEHRCRAARGERRRGDHALQVSGDGVGRENGGVVGHVSHDDRVERKRQRPQALVAHDRQRVLGKVLCDHAAGVQQRARHERQPAAEPGIHAQHRDLERAADERGNGCARAAEHGRAELAVDKHPVEENVQRAGYGEQHRAEAGIFRAALRGDVHAADGGEEIRKADVARICRAGLDEVGVVRQHAHDLLRDAKRRHGEQARDRRGNKQRDAHDAVDGLLIAAAVVLRHEYAHAALHAEDHQLHDVKRAVCHRHGGERRLAEHADHERVGHGHGKRHKVLQDHREHEQNRVPDEVFFLSNEPHTAASFAHSSTMIP